LKRVETLELLELGVGSVADVQANLTEMWRINRWLGGLDALTRHLYPRLRNNHLTLVDLGTGSGQVIETIRQWAKQNQLCINAYGLDLAHHTDVLADAMHLPFAAGTVDYFISSLFLHHFTPSQIVELLRTAYRTAKRGLIMSDLIRGWLPYIGFYLIQPVFARHYLTRYDGALSVRRAYQPDELLALARQADIPHAVVHTHFPWRMTLVAEK
jgi:SAM-dependent methyltransferase